MKKRKARGSFSGLAVAIVAAGLSLGAVEMYFRFEEGIPRNDSDLAALPAGVYGVARDEARIRSVGGSPVMGTLADRKGGVICLGQSFTQGAGVPDTQTYPFYLQLLLNRGKFLGPYRSYNIGSPGTGLVRQAAVYDEFAPRLPHALVILTFLSRDEYVTLAEAKGRSLAARAPALKEAFGGTALSRKMANAYYMERQEANAAPVETLDEAREEFSRWLSRLAAASRSNKARFLVVMVDNNAESEGFIRGLCAKEGVLFHRQTFSNSESDMYRVADGHFNGRGNRRLAAEILDVLKADHAV